MDRGAWQATVHRSDRVGHDLGTYREMWYHLTQRKKAPGAGEGVAPFVLEVLWLSWLVG